MTILRRTVDLNPDGFDLTVVAASTDPGYPLDVTLGYRASGRRLEATFVARPGSAYRYCRLGFCLLHPLDNHVGARGTVWHSGQHRAVSFPTDIAPQMETDGMAVPVWGTAFDRLDVALREGLTIRCDFTGDRFEMEDQRNWSDASFKTYCTPASVGSPLETDSSVEHAQTVTVTVSGPKSASSGPVPPQPTQIEIGDEVGTLPRVALWAGSSDPTAWRPRAGFVELNRAIPPLDLPGGSAVGFGINATVHAADRWSILESAVTHGAIVSQAKRICPGRQIHLEPVDFAGDWLDPSGDVIDAPPASTMDPRRREGLGSAFVLASLRSLAADPPERVGYFDAHLAGSPTADLVEQLSARAGCPVLATSAPSGVTALAVKLGNAVDLYLANPEDEPLTVRLSDDRQISLGARAVDTVRIPAAPQWSHSAEGETE
jgi:hypothetical protein